MADKHVSTIFLGFSPHHPVGGVVNPAACSPRGDSRESSANAFGQELVFSLGLDEHEMRVEVLAVFGCCGELLLELRDELVATGIVFHPGLGAHWRQPCAATSKTSIQIISEK